MRETRKSKRTTATALTVAALVLALPYAAGAQQIDQAVEELASEIVESLQAEGKSKIAVIELTDLSGQVTPLGRLVAEELISQLFTRGAESFTLVERGKLEEVLGEQRLGVQGLLERENVETFGRVLGVEAILTGTIGVLDERVRINARLIAVPSAELFATASTYMSRMGLPETYFEGEADFQKETEETSAPGAAPSPAPAGPVATRDFQGITYELLGCSQAMRLITCELVLTNNGADRDYAINLTNHGSKTHLFDQRGHQFFVSRIRLADIEEDLGDLEKYLITEIPTQMTLFFEGVPSSIEFIKILHLDTSDGDVEFRDVHFSGGG